MKIYDAPGHKCRFYELDTNPPQKLEKEELKEKTTQYNEEIDIWQQKLYAENKQSLLVVFQGVDASGKDGLIRSVFSHLNPQGIQVKSFKAPEPHELAHDFLWRVHANVPGKGMIGVFNRSHYEEVLITRVKKMISDKEAVKRFEHINAFEKLITDSGITILKFYLHISKEEQQKRFAERKLNPNKRWKYNPADEQVQEEWDHYRKMYREVFIHTSTERAPWHIVPSDANWYRNYLVSKTIRKALEDLNPRYPKIAF